MKRRLAFFFSAFLLCNLTHAYFESNPADMREMNGIKLSDYPDFDQKWKMVTIRYREDSKEMRQVFANEKAWAGLMKLAPDYENGAVFAKIGIETEEDPSFRASKVPAGAKRFQFMVRDKGKFRDTDGWGYALFDANGRTFPGDPKKATNACAACHRLVPERQFVFSRSMQAPGRLSLVSGEEFGKRITFVQKTAGNLEGGISKLVGSKAAQLESLEGILKQSAFSGTLDEVIPVLLERSKLLARSAVLYLDKNNYSLVRYAGKAEKLCGAAGQRPYFIAVVFNGKKVREATHCQ